MGIMQRTTPHGIKYAVQTDAEQNDMDQLTMLDAYILACLLDTSEAFKKHRTAHGKDDDVMHIGMLCKRDGIRPAWRIDAGE